MGSLTTMFVGTFKLQSGPHGFRLVLEGFDDEAAAKFKLDVGRDEPKAADEPKPKPPGPDDDTPDERPKPLRQCPMPGCGVILLDDGTCPRCGIKQD